MEKKLFRLFDYQKFEENPDLRQIIDSTHARCRVKALSLDDMEWVNAAGQPVQFPKKEEKDRCIKRSVLHHPAVRTELQLVQFIVLSMQFHQFVMRSLLDDPAI